MFIYILIFFYNIYNYNKINKIIKYLNRFIWNLNIY